MSIKTRRCMQAIPKSLKKPFIVLRMLKNEGFVISSNKKAKINNITPRQQRGFYLNCRPLLTGYTKYIPVVLLFFGTLPMPELN